MWTSSVYSADSEEEFVNTRLTALMTWWLKQLVSIDIENNYEGHSDDRTLLCIALAIFRSRWQYTPAARKVRGETLESSLGASLWIAMKMWSCKRSVPTAADLSWVMRQTDIKTLVRIECDMVFSLAGPGLFSIVQRALSNL